MTVVSTKEFNANQNKYFDMAVNEQVFVKRGNYMFLVSIVNNVNPNEYDEVLEPDDDFRKALSAEEFREKLTVVLDRVDKKYANRCKF